MQNIQQTGLPIHTVKVRHAAIVNTHCCPNVYGGMGNGSTGIHVSVTCMKGWAMEAQEYM